VLIRTAANRFILPKEYHDGGAQLSIDEDGIWVEWAGDDGDVDADPPARSITGTYAGVAERTITRASLTFTLGLRMPQRARLLSAISGTVRRRLTIRVPDLHLWVGHAGTIWDLDQSTLTDDGCNAKRIGGTIGAIAGKILRDDREALARIHYLAWEWYRSDADRKSASWALRSCGLLPSWKDLGGTARLYPRLGQIVTTMQASGQSYGVNTPISRVEYDNRTGQTTWHTDWAEFDYGA
jgi:hypothetical protein